MFLQLAAALAGNWYDDIDSVYVFSPGDDVGSFAWNLYSGNTEVNQFSDKRYALLLKTGSYPDAEIPIGYYTSVMGVGDSQEDVVVQSFYSNDNPQVGNACDNFWRHVEGVTATNSAITWAASQSAPIRRVHVQGDLWLSQGGAPHWSSGGLLADSTVDGTLHMGTQQQYLVRNAKLAQGAVGTDMNYVFVGVDGAPASSDDGTVTSLSNTPRAAAKPFLTENNGRWSIQVPRIQTNSFGPNSLQPSTIDFQDVFIAKDGDTSDSINAGIVGKKALLLTPAIYGLSKSISIDIEGFVVLGIGFPTLVTTIGNSAIEVYARNVRVAAVLLEAGTPESDRTTKPLLFWPGDQGVGSDIFTRVGAFKYARDFKPSCLKTRADVHAMISGNGVTLENLWFWHADHDDCGGASDQCNSQHGLVATGDDIVAYGLKAEHMFSQIALWYGEQGQVYLFQAELPYHTGSYPYAAYMVDQTVKQHTGVGIGTYLVANYTVDTAVRVPATATMTNVFTWSILGSNTDFRSVVCNSAAGMKSCFDGDRCDSNACYVYHLPSSHQKEAVVV
jgi:hypothetical protein